jgi:MFS family permease
VAENAAFYIFTVFVLTYATVERGLPRTMILNALLVVSAIEFFVIPTLGILSDGVGRRPVYLAGAVGLAVVAFPFFWMIDTGNPLVIGLAILLGMMCHAAMYAPQAAFFSELFGTDVRYTGASIGYQLASPLAGGLAPLISAALIDWTSGKPWPVAVYMIGMAGITLVSVWLAAETHRSELTEEAAAES